MLRPKVIMVIENKFTIVCKVEAQIARYPKFSPICFLLSEFCCLSKLVQQNEHLLNDCFRICESASYFW